MKEKGIMYIPKNISHIRVAREYLNFK